MKKELSTAFVFEESSVRVLGTWDTPWFVAVDVCSVLDIKNSRDAVKRLDEDEKGVVLTDTPGGKQEVSIVNESGLYTLILRSRKPEAKAFRRFVTHEVLPSIRKYGYYDPRVEHTGCKGRPRLSEAERERREKEKRQQKREAAIARAEKKKIYVLANGERQDANDLRCNCRALGASLSFISGDKQKMVDFLNAEMARLGIMSADDIWRFG